MDGLNVLPLKTRIFRPGEDLAAFVLECLPQVHERMVLAVTSKIMSLAENRLVPRDQIDKAALVRREANVFLGEIGHGCFLTIKEGLFIPSAGIDESNSATGDYILFPSDPFASCEKLWQALRAAWKIEALGILLTDSHTTPLRRGVTGISLAHWGFQAIREMIGTEDLFGRPLKMTNMNLADGLAASAVMMMGEGGESQPLAVISGAPVDFSDKTSPGEVRMPPDEDLYAPFFRGFREQL